MKLLIVLAHPSHQSFNAALSRTAADEAQSLDHEVIISDLYADGFGAVAGPDDFLTSVKDNPFHYQSQQKAAALNAGFAPDIAREQERLLWADCVLLQFPLWWGGPPAIFKGWFDRVSAYGVTYADGTRFDTGLFAGRRAMVSVTTGGTPHRFTDKGGYGDIAGLLRPVEQLFLGYLGFDVHPALVSYAAPRVTDSERADYLVQMRDRTRMLLADMSVPPPIAEPAKLLADVGSRSWNSAG